MDRSVLLPPYLEDNQVWADLVAIVDEVFKTNVDDPTEYISKLRYLWIQSTAMAEKIENGEMIAESDWEQVEKEILIKQAAQMGFQFADTDLLSREDYQRLVRNLSLYWYSKGRPGFQDFLGMILNINVQSFILWSTTGSSWDRYGTMLIQGDPGIGTPVWEGGTWFPTTHVALVVDPFPLTSSSYQKLVNLFYEIANFNLVVSRVVLEGSVPVHSVDEETLARVLVVYPMWSIEQAVETVDYPLSTPGSYAVANALLSSFSRASTASRINAGSVSYVAINEPRQQDGLLLLENASTNIVLQSENLGVTWVDSSVTSSSTTEVAPDGQADAHLVLDNNAGTLGFKSQNIDIPDDTTTYCASVFVKKGTSACASLYGVIGGSGITLVQAQLVVDLDTGAVQWRNIYPGISFGTQSLSNGWYRIWMTFQNNNGGNTLLTLQLVPAFAATYTDVPSAAAIGSAMFWGVQVEAGNAPTSYIPTTTVPASRSAEIARSLVLP